MCHEGNSINILIKAARAQESLEALTNAFSQWLGMKKQQRAAQCRNFVAAFSWDRYSSQRTGLQVCMLPIMVHLLHSLCLFHLLSFLPSAGLKILTKAFVFHKLAAAAGGEKEKGSAGFNWRTLSSYDWAHGNMCLSLLITLLPSLFYVLLEYTFFLAKVSRGKTPS